MDKTLKANFREDARRIVARDRSARKYGGSHDMVAEITAAMATAYQIGLDHGRNPPDAASAPVDDASAIAWELVPPTSRSVLEYLTFSYSTRPKPSPRIAHELAGYLDPETGRHRWRELGQGGADIGREHSFADKGVTPLVRLGLLAPNGDDKEHLILTAKGDATCRLYWTRSDRNDPTLPIMSLR